MKYSESFKAKMVQKMAGGRSASALSAEVGVNQPTLSRWLREAGRLRLVKRRTQEDKDREIKGRRPEEWSAEEKFQAVLGAKGLTEGELGEFLRHRGLHEQQLREWEAAAVESLRGHKARGKSAEAKRVKELERELRRKEKALAETAALLVLRKKAEALWGAEDASTESNSDDESSS
jgi:transposase-like protein